MKNINRDNIFRYIVAFLIILTGGSIFDNLNKVNLYLSEVFVLFFIFWAVFYVRKNIKNIDKRKIILISSIILIYQIIFIMYHVILKDNTIAGMSAYIIKFTILFLLLSFYFISENDGNKFKDILSKMSNIIVVLTAISIFFYFMGSILKIMHPTGEVEIMFGKKNNIPTYFLMYFESQLHPIFNHWIYRNCSIFCEAPMFNIFLILALSYELLFNDKINMKKVVIISFGIITSISLIGIILMSLIFLYRILVYTLNKSRSKKLKVMLYGFIVFLCILCVYLFGAKLQTSSYSVRTNNFSTAFLLFKNKPIFGYGYNNYTIENEIAKGLYNKTYSLSSSFAQILVDGGIYLTLLYLLPLCFITYHYIKERKYNNVLFILINFILFLFMTYAYTLLIVFELSYMYILSLKIVEGNLNKKNLKTK